MQSHPAQNIMKPIQGNAQGAGASAHAERLTLREFCDDDLNQLTAMHRDPRMRQWLLDEFPLDQQAVCRLFLREIARYYRRHEGLGIWHAALKSTDALAHCRDDDFVGWFSLMPMPGQRSEPEIGGRLRPGAWGSGLAIEGGVSLLRHAFEELQAPAVWGTCHPRNRSACAVLQALGFDALGEAPYGTNTAAHYRLRMNDWIRMDDLTPVSRLRRAVRARRHAQNAQCQPTTKP